jgi:peroxiredoxin
VGTDETDKSRRREEALEIFDRLQSEFADVKIGNVELGTVAEQQAFELKHLCIGCTPPQIEGQDAEGNELRLSDYRGKVVVIDFWADWCPHCVEMYPLGRKIVKRNADKPFAWLGVNSDEPSRLKRIAESEQISWRNWSDGPEGPINKSWRVEKLPSLYVLDHEGVIRFKDVRDENLEQAVDTLLEKVPSEQKDGASAKTDSETKDADEANPTEQDPRD